MAALGEWRKCLGRTPSLVHSMPPPMFSACRVAQEARALQRTRPRLPVHVLFVGPLSNATAPVADPSPHTEPKHFAAYSDPEGGTNGSPAHVGRRELHEVFLRTFDAAVRAGARGIMAGTRAGHTAAECTRSHTLSRACRRVSTTAYNEIDGVPNTVNYDLLTTWLRNETGFEGWVVGIVVYNMHVNCWLTTYTHYHT